MRIKNIKREWSCLRWRHLSRTWRAIGHWSHIAKILLLSRCEPQCSKVNNSLEYGSKRQQILSSSPHNEVTKTHQEILTIYCRAFLFFSLYSFFFHWDNWTLESSKQPRQYATQKCTRSRAKWVRCSSRVRIELIELSLAGGYRKCKSTAEASSSELSPGLWGWCRVEARQSGCAERCRG